MRVFAAAMVSFAALGCGRTGPEDDVAPSAPPSFDATLDTEAAHDEGVHDSVQSFDLGATDSGSTIDTRVVVDSSVPDLGPPLPCDDAGFLIELRDDAGTRVFTHGCGDAGPDLPTAFRRECGEDDFGVDCLELHGCEGRAAIALYASREPVGPGPWAWMVERMVLDDGDGGTTSPSGWGTLHLTIDFPWGGDPPPIPRALGRDYTFDVYDPDSSTGPPPILTTLAGRFCVEYVGISL
jgi:hypothetical protein